MTDKAILLFGVNGQLGFDLQKVLTSVGNVIGVDRKQIDLSQPESIRSIVRSYRPAVIVNAAAYTAVDKAESDVDMAYAVNALAPEVLAEEAQACGAIMLHYSTDYVFDGQKAGYYTESDTPNPQSIYGRSKLLGEQAVGRVCERHFIFRTSWVVGQQGGNFLKTILRLATEREKLRIVADQLGVPTTSELIAEVSAQVLCVMRNIAPDDKRWGLYHLVAGGETNWHAYAQYIITLLQRYGHTLKITPEDVEPITTAEYPLPAVRPANSRLDTIKLRSVFSCELPDWKVGVNNVLLQLISQQQAAVG